MVPKNTATI